MICPNCNHELKMTERQSVEIDYCPNCRGVWLDRGELDKIIERTNSYYKEPDLDNRIDDDRRYDADRSRYSDDYNYKNRKKKKSFLGDFFDFD